MAGYNTLTVQQFEVYDELANVLETDFAGGNQVLTELQDFYDSCITTHMSDEELELRPIRDFYQRLGQFLYLYSIVDWGKRNIIPFSWNAAVFLTKCRRSDL